MSDGDREDKLDVFSEKFDALEALYSEFVVVPWKKAPAFDNVAKFEWVASDSDGTESFDKVLQKKTSIRVKEMAEKAKKLERQLPVPSTSKQADADEKQLEEEEEGRPKRRSKLYDNVLTLAEKIEGPLAFLRNCMHHRVRLKVLTRSRASIRGYCLGFVVAFDKHWNLALEDVTEVWTRKIKRKTVPLGVPSEPPEEWLVRGPPLLPPPVNVISRRGRKETCERYVRQLLIRGEHVVLVSVATPLQKPMGT